MLAQSESDVPEEARMIMGRPVPGQIDTRMAWPWYLAGLVMALVVVRGGLTAPGWQAGLHGLLLTGLLATMLLGQRLSFTPMARLWQAMTLLTAGLVLYQWLWQVVLSPLGLLLPLLMLRVLPWRCLCAGIAVLGGLLLIALALGQNSGLAWSYVGAYGLSSWMALLLAYKVQMMDDSVSEANSDYPLAGVYNARRLEVDLGREISRAERSDRSLVVMVLTAADVADIKESGAVLEAGYLQAVCSVIPPHCAVYRWNAAMLVILMPACDVDDVTLLNADMSDALGIPLNRIHGLPLFYTPSSGQAAMKAELDERIDSMMDAIRKLAQ